MDRDPWPSTYDRDLDAPTRPPADPTEPIDPYRRLVVNPLLAIAFVIGAILLLRASLRWRSLWAFLTAVHLLGASIFLIQFHCLDCGRTTWFHSWRRHACNPMLARWSERRRRWPFLGVGIQAMLWFVLVVAVSCQLLIFYATRL